MPAERAEFPGNCKASSDYDAYIKKAEENIYDPKALGDLGTLHHKYDCAIAADADPVEEAKAAIKTGNLYDEVYTAKDLQKAQSEQDGFGGVGAILKQGSIHLDGQTYGDVEVVKPLVDSPAKKAGLRKHDVIEKIDGKSVLNLKLHDVVENLHGPVGSKVNLTVVRYGAEKPISLTREEIKDDIAVTPAKNLGDNVEYIRVTTFDEYDVTDLLKHEIESHPEAKGFIIDVRDNQGGFIDQAMQSAELFIKDGPIMSMRMRVPSDPQVPKYSEVSYSVDGKKFYENTAATAGGAAKSHSEARVPYLLGDRPVVVLANEISASAAELFTGALHDTAHVTTLGEKTFGKGIGQSFYPNLPRGGTLKITDLHYLTPSGKWPGDANSNRIGLDPDITVLNPDNADIGSPQDSQLSAALKLMKDKLQLRR